LTSQDFMDLLVLTRHPILFLHRSLTPFFF
jgi:hypothetical protein